MLTSSSALALIVGALSLGPGIPSTAQTAPAAVNVFSSRKVVASAKALSLMGRAY